MRQGGNPNHPKKGSRITVDPIRKIKDIKAISKLTSANPRDHLLFVMGINNGLRACDLVKVQVGDIRYLKVGDTLTIKESKTGKDTWLLIKPCIKPYRPIWTRYGLTIMHICLPAGRVKVICKARPSVSWLKSGRRL